MCSVTIRTPESSSVRRWSVPLGVTVAAVPRAAGAARAVAAVAAPVAAAAVVAVAARAAVTVAAVPARAAAVAAAATGADGGQLLDGLAGDLGVLGQAQADPAALAVDLDHADGDLVALVEDLLDGVDALARRDVGDVQQPVGALGQLDEGAERGRLDDLAGERVADLDLLGHRPDALGQLLAELAVGGVHEDLAVVVDVDLGLELLRQAADRLAALADEQADLGRVDLHRDDAGRVGRQLLTRAVDGVLHLTQDVHPGIAGLGERVAQDVERDARDLDVHLQGGDALGGAG